MRSKRNQGINHNSCWRDKAKRWTPSNKIYRLFTGVHTHTHLPLYDPEMLWSHVFQSNVLGSSLTVPQTSAIGSHQIANIVRALSKFATWSTLALCHLILPQCSVMATRLSQVFLQNARFPLPRPGLLRTTNFLLPRAQHCGWYSTVRDPDNEYLQIMPGLRSKIIDGKRMARRVREEVAEEVRRMVESGKRWGGGAGGWRREMVGVEGEEDGRNVFEGCHKMWMSYCIYFLSRWMEYIFPSTIPSTHLPSPFPSPLHPPYTHTHTHTHTPGPLSWQQS